MIFIAVCLPVRIAIAAGMYFFQDYAKIIKIIGFFLASIALSFFSKWLFSTATLGGFGGKVYWNDFRPVHGVLYGLAAYLCFFEEDKAYIPLAVDVLIGLLVFLRLKK